MAKQKPADPLTGEVEQPRTTALVPRVSSDWKLSLGQDIRSLPTNLDLSSQKGKALFMAAGNPGDIQLEGDDPVEIVAVNYLVYLEEGTNPETGELSVFPRVVLFDKRGQTFRTTSAHAPSRLKAALELYTPEEWANGIPFVIRARYSKATKRHYHDIRVRMVWE